MIIVNLLQLKPNHTNVQLIRVYVFQQIRDI